MTKVFPDVLLITCQIPIPAPVPSWAACRWLTYKNVFPGSPTGPRSGDLIHMRTYTKSVRIYENDCVSTYMYEYGHGHIHYGQ